MELGRNLPSDIEWQVLKEVSLHPLTLYGISLGIGSVAFGLLTLSVLPLLAAWMVLLGMIASGIGALSWLVNYFFRYDTVLNICLKQFAHSAEEQRRNEINLLHQKLIADGDPRTEKLLENLLALITVFQNVKQWEFDSYSQFEIAHKVNALFEEGIKNLEQTLHLWHTARNLGGGMVRDTIIFQREELINDLIENIDQLSRVLKGLHESNIKDRSQQLRNIVQELDATMAIAQRVQERMRNFDANGKITVS